MADPGFVHLHVHSSYSLLQGALPIARLADLAKPPTGSTAGFVSPDLSTDGVIKSGYTVTVAKDPGAAKPAFEKRDHAAHDAGVEPDSRPEQEGPLVGKEEPPENILNAIEKVHAGEIWLDRATTGRVFVECSRRARSAEPQSDELKRIATLTARERQIVQLLTREPETSITALAKKIHTSEHTLRNHLTSIYNKLGIAGRLQLHIFASRHRLG